MRSRQHGNTPIFPKELVFDPQCKVSSAMQLPSVVIGTFVNLRSVNLFTARPSLKGCRDRVACMLRRSSQNSRAGSIFFGKHLVRFRKFNDTQPNITLQSRQLMEAHQKMQQPNFTPASRYNKEQFYDHQNTKSTSSNYQVLTQLTSTFMKAIGSRQVSCFYECTGKFC